MSQPCILEQTRTKSLLVCVASALVTPSPQGIPVRLLKLRSDPVVLHKNTSDGTIEPIEGTPICPVSLNKPDLTSKHISPFNRTLLHQLEFQNNGLLSLNQSYALLSVLTDYTDIFAESPDDVGRTGLTKHRIHTGEAAPICQLPQRIPAAWWEEAQSLIKDMLEKDTIQLSNSPWASPIVLVQKKDGILQFCLDYRKLNAITRKDAYHHLRVDDTLDTLAESQWFTTLAKIIGYWQVEVRPSDREKTAICIPEGLFQFKIMPFGLCNTPATFQRLNSVLAGLPWNTCLVYLDDIIVSGITFPSHLENIRQVFSHIRGAGLKLQPSKCALCRLEVSLLEHIVSPKGITTDLNKINKAASWPTPMCKREIQQF